MSRIIQLSETVANMIAAGEVVESPFSVVKELVENSIDAKASEITINLTESGIKMVEVIDNGIGMDHADALLAFNRHATSKIKTAYDLASINTLGFRGEALPSIASVSTLCLMTKEHDSPIGTKITLKAGRLISDESLGMNNGTRIIVSNLFYNTPARLKYLKAPNVILASICDLVDKLALVNRKIRFTLRNNNQVLLQTHGKEDIENLFALVYGVGVAKNLRHAEDAFDGTAVAVTVTNPTISRSRKNDITVSVNGRYVKSNLVINAVNDAFKDYLPPLRYPIALIEIKIDSLLIDVNVHPQKMEIKFSSENDVYNLVKRVVLMALKEAIIIPSSEPIKIKPILEPLNFDTFLEEKPQNQTKVEEKVEIKYNDAVEKSESFVLEEPLSKETPKALEETPKINEEVFQKRLPYLEYIGQYAGTYLIFQNEEGLYLVDQHAAQERCNYEYYYDVLAHPQKESIPLLIPYNIEFTKEEAISLASHLEEFKAFGLHLEPSGLTSFFIREIPVWIKADKPEAMIEKMLYFLLEKKNFSIGALRDSMAKMMACKASIKANHFVDKEGAYNLLKDLNKCRNPFNCPHGRPVFVKFSLNEIEKLFMRVV